METNFATFLNILAEPPGDLIFHLAVSLSLLLLLTTTVVNRKLSQNGNRSPKSLVGYGIIFVLHLLLFLLRPISLHQFPNGNIFYPLFERLAATLTILWIILIFYDHEEFKIPNYLIISLSLALIIFAVVSNLVVPRLLAIPNINISTLDILWQIIAFTLTLIGIAMAIFNPPPNQMVMLFIFVFLAVGHLLQIIFFNRLQWNMGAIRFAQTLSLPWMLGSIYQRPKVRKKSQINGDEESDDQEERLFENKSDLTNHLLKISLYRNNEEKYQAIAKALSLSVISEICFLVRIHEQEKKLRILTGYDLIREAFLGTSSLAMDDLPRIIAAWQEDQPLEISQNHVNSKDVTTLKILLQYQGVGGLFAYPLGLPDQPLVGGIIFLSPYTGKSFGDKTIQLLDEIKDTLGQVLFSPGHEEHSSQELLKVKNQVNKLTDEQQQLQREIERKETLLNELKAKYELERVQAKTSIDQMKSRINELNSKLTDQQRLAEQVEQMKTAIRQLQSEREKLNIELNRANAIIKDLQMQTGQTGPVRLSLDSQVISLDSIAANIRLQVASQLKQKNIDLEINNPDGRMMIRTDPELLQTALFELISNAIKISDSGGTIRLDQKLSLEMGVLIVQVTDFGDGLSENEQTALFSGQHDTIPGIGNVAAIRKAIRAIRVLNGKIWLKSKKASYTTFRFQIPIRIID